MRKQFIISCSIILTGILFFAGCKKDIKDQPTASENETLARGSHDDHKNGCRLTAYDYYDGIADFHAIDNYSYKNGLVDEWSTYYGSVYKMEYDKNDRLKKSLVYEDGVLVNTIYFFYRNDKVVKEIWYTGNTKDIDDLVYYTYNRKGQMFKSESVNYDFYTTNTYHRDGNLASWKMYVAGSPSISGEYTYYNNYKNPLQLTPGSDHYFPYTNAAFGTFDKWYSSEKITIYDEAGLPSVYYDLDPRKTRWNIGQHNYPTHVDYVDRQTGTAFSVGFGFENCGHNDKNYSSHKSNETNNRKASVSIKVQAIHSILSGSRKGIKQRINELRKSINQ